ncbi:Sphingosine N-acyltransferase lag1 [Tolypocladium paradoxum]|uniref:Sphingosine N-acyltransferase lag1 n=1 Tax=Tolypocladium paradoxum TaxID=94208 RepID=A0A2S4L7Y8_9HYPO|nr:Sphingosine N-acyltransferase lag1 [Tolypocladium paradoxum]
MADQPSRPNAAATGVEPEAHPAQPRPQEVVVRDLGVDMNGGGPPQRGANNTPNPVAGRVNKKAKKQRDDGQLAELSRWFLDNQAGIAFNLLALLFLTHACIPRARPSTAKFFQLSRLNPRTGKYATSTDDFCFMAFCFVLFTGLRAGVMDHVLAPLARRRGVAKKKAVTRFAEQAWIVIYCSVFWPLGMFIYCNSPYFLNMSELWTNWPDRELDGLMKFYVLAQLAFWIQQVVVVHIEKRRKDHWQMLTHHFITIALISASYAYHQTKVGNLIMVLMDVVELLLPVAKCLKYLGGTTICDVLFGVFLVTWFIARHVFYLMTCWSIYTDLPRIIAPACYRGTMDDIKEPLPVPDGWSHVLEPFYDPKGMVCFDGRITYLFLSCLLFLQLLTIMWFAMILQVAARVLKGSEAEDLRSDDESEEDDEEDMEDDEARPFTEEVSAEDMDLKAWEQRRDAQRAAASTSGVSLPGHSERKKLLNRIGCDKQIS